MKNIIILVMLSMLVLTGCNTGAPEERAQDSQPQQMSTERTDGIKNVSHPIGNKEGTKLPFMVFDLEIDYVDTLSYEIEYRQQGDQTTAVINEIGKEEISGEKAFDQLTPHFMELSFDEESSKDEVINDVLNVFGLDETYKEFKLYVTYNNGQRLEYED
ncbi:YusW-like protein [Halobacillus dabanensis]|uniref:YusW-like protein n=1 Tax=Halobacillus dabanensis TaxID=240302 RepID=A0A1I3VVU1_HALDA|nr:YusW family protein [Halobacillus dabanensis]SFJ98251.1 YusW-like protein [Halobacillus dabanensis]